MKRKLLSLFLAGAIAGATIPTVTAVTTPPLSFEEMYQAVMAIITPPLSFVEMYQNIDFTSEGYEWEKIDTETGFMNVSKYACGAKMFSEYTIMSETEWTLATWIETETEQSEKHLRVYDGVYSNERFVKTADGWEQFSYYRNENNGDDRIVLTESFHTLHGNVRIERWNCGYVSVSAESVKTNKGLAFLFSSGFIPSDTVGLTVVGNGFYDISELTDLSPLVELTDLTQLSVYGSAVSDLSPLQDLSNLEGLTVQSAQISDLAPLAGMANLASLSLEFCQISDISPLAGLVNLRSLNLTDNQISDISALSGMTELFRLDLANNQISDISALEGFVFKGVDVFGGSADLSGNLISDIAPLSGASGLTRLYLENNQISDVSPLANLTNLGRTMGSLWLRGNQISDVLPLAMLTRLDEFSLLLDGNPVSEENLAQLEEARERNRVGGTLTLGHLMGYTTYTVSDALEILRFVIGLPSVIDECEIAKIAARTVSESGDPTINDALAILRGIIGLE